MTTKDQAGNVLAAFIAACGLAACVTTAVSPGDSGASTGSAGSGGSGATVTCGSGRLTPTGGTLCLPPAQTITDFTYDPDSGATDQVTFGTYGTTFSGGEDFYANAPATLTSDVTQGDWHLMGNVANYSGFALYFDSVNGCNMVDASAYAGITFTIWGTDPNMITMFVPTMDDTPTPSWFTSVDASVTTPTPGSCTPTSGSQYYHPGCADPMYAFHVTGTQASPQTVTINWTDFTGGLCEPNVNPSQIVGMSWQFLWSSTATPYNVDIHIDNLTFIPTA